MTHQSQAVSSIKLSSELKLTEIECKEAQSSDNMVVVQDVPDETKIEAITPTSTCSTPSRTPVHQIPALVITNANENTPITSDSQLFSTPNSDTAGNTNTSESNKSFVSLAQSTQSLVSHAQRVDWSEACSPMRTPVFQTTPLPRLKMNMRSPLKRDLLQRPEMPSLIKRPFPPSRNLIILGHQGHVQSPKIQRNAVNLSLPMMNNSDVEEELLSKLARAGMWPNNMCSNRPSESFKARSQTGIKEEIPPMSEITSFARSYSGHIPELACPRDTVPIHRTENHIPSFEATFPKAPECAHILENDYTPTEYKLKSSVEAAQLLIMSQPSSSGSFSPFTQILPEIKPIPRNAPRMLGSRWKSKLSKREYPRRRSGFQAARGRSVRSQEKLPRFPIKGEKIPRVKLNNGRGRGSNTRRRFRGSRCGKPRIFNSQ